MMYTIVSSAIFVIFYYYFFSYKVLDYFAYFLTMFINFLASFPSINTTGRSILSLAEFNYKKMKYKKCQIFDKVVNYVLIQ